MKSIRWIGWVALVALFVVPLAATSALAAPDFAGTPLTPNIGQTVTFTPSGVTGAPDSITWNFGDGGYANGAGVKTHEYGASGSFTVTMVIWYTATPDSAVTKPGYVAVSPMNFTGAPLYGAVPLTTTFTPTGITGTPDSIAWRFGDGFFLQDAPPLGPVVHTYTTGPAVYDVEMHVWYAGVDSTVRKWTGSGFYVQTVWPLIQRDSVNAAPCNGAQDVNLPDTAYFTYIAPPLDSVWWVIDTMGTAVDSVRTTGTSKYKLNYVFTWPDSFTITAKPFSGDSLNSGSMADTFFVSHSCYCVKAVLDGWSGPENGTLIKNVLDNDTLGDFGSPQPVLSVTVTTWNNFKADTVYFDTTTWEMVYVPLPNWHGKDTLTYAVSVENGCFADTATVAITIESNFIVDIDSLWYVFINSSSCGSCDASLPDSTINLGDSLQLWVKINPVDVQELAAGWPKVNFAGLGGTALPGYDLMFRDTTLGTHGGAVILPSKDSVYFSIPFQVQNTPTDYEQWRGISGGGIDVAPNAYSITAIAWSTAGKADTTIRIVTHRIDTKGPILPANSVLDTMVVDSLSNGIVGMGDWLKFFIDLRNNPIISNPPGKKELCDVYVLLDTLWGLDQPGQDSRIFVQLYDSANDNRWKGFYRVGQGRLQAPANSQIAWFYITDNACNLDSAQATLVAPVDNKAPLIDTTLITYKELKDLDGTGCLGVGESDALADSVLLRVTGVGSDIDSMFADLLRAGIGGTPILKAARYPLTNLGGGVWELRTNPLQPGWLLKTNQTDKVKHPLDGDSLSPTFDSLAKYDSVKIMAKDLSGNWDEKWSNHLEGINDSMISLDTRVPKPVTGLMCMRDTTSSGTVLFRLKWTWQDPDAEKFLIRWNEGCGPVNHDTLAVSFSTTWSYWWNKWSPTDSALDSGYTWLSDSTVHPISPCRNYSFEVITIDNCNNWERAAHPTTTCPTLVKPVTDFVATNTASGEITMTWTGTDSSARRYDIYWDKGSGTINFSDPTFKLGSRDSVGPGPQSWVITDCSKFPPGLIGDSVYKFAIRTVDSCEINTPVTVCADISRDLVGVVDTAAVRHIRPVAIQPSCQSIAGGAIQLRWTSPENTSWLGTMVIHYGKDSANAINWTYNIDTISYHQAGVWVADSGFYRWNTTMANPQPAMVEHGGYAFTVESIDKCGIAEVQHATPTFCYSDKAPAYACVIQPEPGSLYCDNAYHGLTIYTCAKDSASNDIKTVTAWGRLQDISPAAGNQPGDWFQLGGSSLSEPGVCFHINLDPFMLNYQVGADTVQRVEIAIATTDFPAGKTITPDEAWAACTSHYWFDWSTRVIDGNLLTINGQQRVFQTFCGTRGYQIYGPTNPVAISVSGGTPPFALQVIVDGNNYLYQERVDRSITFNLNALNFTKGGHYMQVFWSDSCGWTGSAGDSLCVPDSIPPCALVTNPVDGKCIRRAMSMKDPIGQYEDPITIHIEGNDLTPNGRNCIDQSGVLKVDFQWAKTCCAGGTTNCVDSTIKDSVSLGGGGIPTQCDSFYTDGHLDSIVCADTSFAGWKYTFRDTTICTPCSDDWHTFAIDSANGTDTYTAKWYNHDELAWITESGTNIYLRGVVYDASGNIYYTPCVQVCIDIDTPPICIRTENLCPDGHLKGFAKILAEIDWANGNTDDIEDVYLYTKKHSDPDLFGFWASQGIGLPATNSTMWTWDVDLTGFEDQTYYDFRVIAKTTWGTWSYDLDGNTQFDANTFDDSNCDAKTWLVDNTAPKIAIDTAWTMINDNELVIPNTGCRVSDPKGYVWTQFGHTITIQPTIYPLYEMGDVVKTQWTLYDGSGLSGATCGCEGSQSAFDAGDGALSYVFAVNEGSHAMDKLVFDPTAAPFVHVTTGYQKHVLHVKSWDGCGNTSEDCIEVYLLDIDTTEAILISPVNDSVFCDKMSSDGGIRLTAATLLSNEMKKAVFAYRPEGTSTWIVIDSVEIPPVQGNKIIGEGTLSIVWYPKAAGLADGDYELTVWATDGALNHQGPDGYPVTIHLSCAVPTVTMTYPQTGDPAFIGCPIEVTATASSTDPGNPIVEVNFYIQSIMNTTSWLIGSDNFTVDGLWSVAWDPHSDYWKGKLSDGQYYMWAEAKNRAGMITKTVLKDVIIRYDETGPHSEIIQVNGDRSDGGATDPTIVESGDIVPLYVLSADDLSPAGYGLTDNSGLDSVMLYVTEDASIGGKVIFGELMTPVDSLSSLYVRDWPTEGLPRGLYHVTVVAIDKACNTSSCKCDWLVRIVNPPSAAILGVTEAVTYCGQANVKDGPIHLTLTPPTNEAVSEVEFWRSKASSSDVYDMWSFVGFSEVLEDGMFTYEVDAESLAVWAEGLYRIRAFYKSTDGTWIDDGNHNSKFDDFTFDPANKTWQMLLNVDRSVTDFSVALDPSMTLLAGRQVKVTVTPDEACDVAQVCYGAVAENGNYGAAVNGCVDSTRFSFNPVDSGLVSLENGVWHGSIRAQVTDPLGNTAYGDQPLWILELSDTNQVRVVDPPHGSYVTASGPGDTLTSVTARKLTWTALDSVVFYHAANATDAGERFGKAAKTTGSDEFTSTWNLKNVPEGDRYIWGVAWRGATKFNNAPKTWVIIVKPPKNIVLRAPSPNSVRRVGPDDIMFVGGRVDLCLDRDSISSIVSGVGIDSVVFGYRYGDAPGGVIPENPDGALGWVRIDTDRYGSLCVDWFACDTIPETCQDGRYALVAWVYNKAGQVNHSNVVHVMVDCTDPYSEIVDIEGDETFGTCHETIGGTKVPVTGVVADDRSCAGSTPLYNSGAKLLQFFAGQCGEGATSGGAADIVFVIDYSGSMGEEITKVQAAVTSFATSLSTSGVNFGLGLVEACSPMTVAQTVTTNVGTFNSAVNSAGCSGGVQSYDALTGIANGTINVGFRPGSKKFIILITDTSPESGTASSIEFCNVANPPEEAAVASAMTAGGVTLFAIVETPTDPSYSGSCALEDHNAYDQIVTATNGDFFDLDASSYEGLFTQISGNIVASLGSTESPLSVVFTETITNPEPQETVYWNTTGLAPGKYCVWTRAEDAVGNVYISSPVEVCIVDRTAPVAWIAGFGMSTDEHGIHDKYRIYTRSWDTDIQGMMFQSKKSGETDWVTIGIASKVEGDSSFWQTSWNPCGVEANFDMRAVPTDKVGNSDPSKQPILKIHLDGACNVTLPEEPAALSVGFEDRAFANLGITEVKGAPSDNKLTEMTAVYADEVGGLGTEKVTLHRGLTTKSYYEGSFDDSMILNGGTGWFWAVYNDFSALKTYLKKGDLKVWLVTDVGFPDTLKFPSPATTVMFQDEAVTSANGVVIYPAHDPTVWLDQQHLRAWPSIEGTDMVTAIRLTAPLEGGFNTGRYAKVTIKYFAPGIPTEDLGVAWWNGDHWEMEYGIRAGSIIANGEATFWTDNLYGVYAVISAGGVFYPGAVDVRITDPASGGSTNAWPAFHAIVKSKLNMEYENQDIDWRHIIVTTWSTADPSNQVTLLSGDNAADDWSHEWDEVSGALLVAADQPWCGDFNPPTTSTVPAGGNGSAKPVVWPGLTAGQHWVKVQAFNKQGYWNVDSTSFTVDAAEPVVTAEGARTVCPNATFHVTITDVGSGVNWDSVFIDVHSYDASETVGYPSRRLLETVGPDDVVRNGNVITFTVNYTEAELRRAKLVIYDGIHFIDRNCECVLYDNVCDGVPDMVGNHTEIVEVMYTIDASACVDTTGGTAATVTGTGGSSNPFDPYSAGFVTINFNGFVAGGGKVTADVYDLTGEHVKSLVTGQFGATWDGTTDESDKKVAEGVYLIHLQRTGGMAVGSTSQVLKVVVKRK